MPWTDVYRLNYQFTVTRQGRKLIQTLYSIRDFRVAMIIAKKSVESAKNYPLPGNPSKCSTITWEVKRDAKWHVFWVWKVCDMFNFVERYEPTERFEFPGDAAMAADWLCNGFPDMRKKDRT
jgi:hypothetical protein